MRKLKRVPNKPSKKKEVKVRVPAGASLTRFLLKPAGQAIVVGLALAAILGMAGFTFFYVKYARLINEKLSAGPFAHTAKIFAAPESVAVGGKATPESIAAELQRGGYTESRGNPIGYYQLHTSSIEIFPGPDSYFDQEAGVIKFAGGKISQIVSLEDNTQRGEYQLEPQLITNLFDRNREKRRLVKFRDIPKVLVEAVTSAEDKRFFQHSGFDPIRIIKAAYVDLKEGRRDQGASTISMQLAGSFWLHQDKSWNRKAAEAIITLQLEQKLSKEEIFEDYANEVYLGWHGSFGIHGFGEAAEAYFGKDLAQLTLPEVATLAGMIQAPPRYNPYTHADRARERRNIVLSLMRQNGFISDREYALAVDAPLNVAREVAQSAEAPYFVDLVNHTLQSKFEGSDFQSNAYRVYTTLDLNLQRAAAEAIRAGMENVDQQIKRQRRFRGKQPPEAQVALIALDPHTGEIKALAGGRNYGASQLNHALAKRQPGSIFKPFVYAAAMDTAVDGGPKVLTPSTTVVDEPTTFWFDGKPYEPDNFEHKFYGTVTLRDALAHSMNVATVKVAEMVGYDAVVAMANRAGLNYQIKPTPAVALGAYEITPLEAAGAYTMFANGGELVKPSFISVVRSQEGKVVYQNKIEKKQVLDPRVAYLMTNLMEEVLRSGTAVGVRAQGFTVPAAGKTGTSHDGWFAGYTSELLCIVWVGFDDNEQLDLEGAHSAAPIWGDFMKRALEYREYRDTKPFTAPAGIVSVEIDPESGMPATPYCPERRTEVYIAGTQPVGSCPLHNGGGQGITSVTPWQTSSAAPSPPDNPPRIASAGENGQGSNSATAQHLARSQPPAQPQSGQPSSESQPPPKEKKSIFRRLLGVFRK